MNKEQKKTIDKIIAIFMYGIFLLPFVLLALIAKVVDIFMKYLFEKAFNPLYHKVCKIARGPIPNSVVCILDEKSKIWANGWEPGWHRVNENLLTIKEAKALGKEYEDKGYKVDLYLSEF